MDGISVLVQDIGWRIFSFAFRIQTNTKFLWNGKLQISTTLWTKTPTSEKSQKFIRKIYHFYELGDMKRKISTNATRGIAPEHRRHWWPPSTTRPVRATRENRGTHASFLQIFKQKIDANKLWVSPGPTRI